MIKIDFEKTDGTYLFRDALHLEDDHGLTEEQIEAMKQARFDNWVAILTAPAESVAETPPTEGV